MLKHLQIENYALIQKLDAEFNKGLTVITGETGAGKSILLGALSLILGERADTRVLNDKTRKCIIEGSFSLENKGLRRLFAHYDLDFEEVSYFRREITPKGKSRAFINDTPVNLAAMKSIAEKLIDIHSQHENLILGSSSFQFDLVDSYAGKLDDASQYRNLFREYRQITGELSELHERERRAKADLDYFQYQYDELEKAQLDPEAYRQMEEDVRVVRHAEEIQYTMEKALYMLQDAEHNVSDLLNEIRQLLQAVSRYGSSYAEIAERIDSLHIEAQDIARETASLKDTVEHDPQQAARLEARLDGINSLLMKHSAANIEELVALKEDYRQKIEQTASLGDQIQKLEASREELLGKLAAQAEELSEARKSAIPEIESEITSLLKNLGMPGGRFAIRHTKAPELTSNGTDELGFLFNANVGGELQDISRVASGGELSRVMLAIKSIISERKILPTIIFDEIDTGISGKTTTRVAAILGKMAKQMQVIAITHLPQIAAKGQTHLLVYKNTEDGRTHTHLTQLDDDQRVIEISKMLGGEKPSKHMVETAKELIFNKEN